MTLLLERGYSHEEEEVPLDLPRVVRENESSVVVFKLSESRGTPLQLSSNLQVTPYLLPQWSKSEKYCD